MKPYSQHAGLTIYHGDCLDVLPDLNGIGAIVTDPPYSSGGAFRGDRVQGTLVKYVNSDTFAYRPEFAGDTRDQRSFAAWCALWLNAARYAAIVGAPVASFSDWRQLPTMTDAIQAAGWDVARARDVAQARYPDATGRLFQFGGVRRMGNKRSAPGSRRRAAERVRLRAGPR